MLLNAVYNVLYMHYTMNGADLIYKFFLLCKFRILISVTGIFLYNERF
jgi:hypothetical protein